MAASTICLFDVDGTLTPSRKAASPEMLAFLQELRKTCAVGIVGGSDLAKICEQLGADAPQAYDYVFAENGLVAFKAGAPLAKQDLLGHLGEARLRPFLNFCLRYIADLDIPVKRGTFIEFRSGMINVSPIGRNCSQSERDAFEAYDKVKGVRAAMVAVLSEAFKDLDLTYSIGGQISFDVFPRGWDKTFCLRFLDSFTTVHFFGDKTHKGGNDHEIFASERTIGHTVTSPEDTVAQVRKHVLAMAAPPSE